MASAWRMPDFGHSRRALANNADAAVCSPSCFSTATASSQTSGIFGFFNRACSKVARAKPNFFSNTSNRALAIHIGEESGHFFNPKSYIFLASAYFFSLSSS